MSKHDPADCHVCGRHAVGVGVGPTRASSEDPRWLCAECALLVEHIRTRDCAVYVTHTPCAGCVRALIQAGIRAVYCGDGKTRHACPRNPTPHGRCSRRRACQCSPRRWQMSPKRSVNRKIGAHRAPRLQATEELPRFPRPP